MNAAKYLFHLQRRCVSEEHFRALETLNQLLAMHRDMLEKALSATEWEGIKDIPIGALPTFDCNAFAIRAPSGGAVVCVDMLFPLVIDQVNRAFSNLVFDVDTAYSDLARLVIGFGTRNTKSLMANRTQPMQKQNRVDFRKILSEFNEMDKLSPAERAAREQVGPIPETMIRSWEQADSTELAQSFELFRYCQLIFVLGHEITHITRGHLDERDLVPGALFGPDSEQIEIYRRSVAQEFEADEGGFRVLMSIVGHTIQAVIACEQLIMFLALVENIFIQNAPVRTHPPAVERLQNLRLQYPKYPGGQGLRERTVLLDVLRESLQGWIRTEAARMNAG